MQNNRLSVFGRWINISIFIATLLIPALLFYFFQFEHDSLLTLIIVATLLISLFIIGYFFSLRKIPFKKFTYAHSLIIFTLLLYLGSPIELQLPDDSFDPAIAYPMYPRGQGPLICFDEGHFNFHTLDNRFNATGKLLTKDGYRVEPFKKAVTLESLKECKIFIVSNSLHEYNVNNWHEPYLPAYKKDEIEALTQWVSEGGALFLIADHSPFPAAIKGLAQQFGFEYINGYALDKSSLDDYFSRESNSLAGNIITNGRNSSEQVDSVLTFIGSAIKIPQDASPLLTLGAGFVIRDPKTKKLISAEGYSQGAFKRFGQGRIIVSGEAAMYTSQFLAGLSWIQMGMNSKKCPDNYQLLLNSIHWLDDKLD